MNLKDKYGGLALVAGASQGLGAAYAEALAVQGFDLILVARRKDVLEQTCREIMVRHSVKVIAVDCDLSDPKAAETIRDAVGPLNVNFLVYNAALPYIGPYLHLPVEEHTRMAFANMITPMTMVHHFGDQMIREGKGAIVLMTSLAGFQGSGFIATYAATKAFNLVLAEGLWYEWKNKGVDIIGCCAGATATPNYINSKPGSIGIIKPQVQAPEAVVNECLNKIGKTPSFVSGMGNRWASFFMRRFISRKEAVKIMGEATRKMYRIDY
jgi:short-subunit dehydrogenase